MTAILLLPLLALGQLLPEASPPNAETDARAPLPGELALAPSRIELPLRPGGSQTVVVNVISSGKSSEPVRLLASLGDWTLDAKGEMRFAKPGTLPESAADWIIYSPVEFSVKGGETYSIRVTVDVPADATPGDHTAALFVEERPPEIKTQKNIKQISFHFRLAALIYVMVEPLTYKGSLVGLEAGAQNGLVTISPTLRNEGNSRVRPLQSFELLDPAGALVASQAPSEGYPILGKSDYSPTLKVEQPLPPGAYSLRYRVDFRDGGKVVEGRRSVVVPEAAPPPAPDAGVRAPPAKKPARGR